MAVINPLSGTGSNWPFSKFPGLFRGFLSLRAVRLPRPFPPNFIVFGPLKALFSSDVSLQYLFQSCSNDYRIFIHINSVSYLVNFQMQSMMIPMFVRPRAPPPPLVWRSTLTNGRLAVEHLAVLAAADPALEPTYQACRRTWPVTRTSRSTSTSTFRLFPSPSIRGPTVAS